MLIGDLAILLMWYNAILNWKEISSLRDILQVEIWIH